MGEQVDKCNAVDVYSDIRKNLLTGEELAEFLSDPQLKAQASHRDLVVGALNQILEGSVLVEGSSELALHDVAELKSSVTFVIFGYSYDAQMGFIVVGEMSKGIVKFYPDYLSLDWNDTTQHPIADIGTNESDILYDEGVANWWHPEHPFQTGKWREALYPNPSDLDVSLFDYPEDLDLLHFLPIDFYEGNDYLWVCPDVFNPTGLFNWLW